MGNIVLLDDLTINQIAAGEVIERPANVVKELVENSIDAGANKIKIEIKNGGKTFIKITDNGSGIKEDDMLISLERHATSKIRKIDDLENTYSMGFRGEALASIVSVSRLTMVTKTAVDEIGRKIVAEAGDILEATELATNTGTAITVENLFFNVPVRYKFLKNDATEFRYIKEFIEKVGLAHPEITIKLINDKKIIFQTSGNGNLRDVIYTFFGKEIKENLIDVNFEEENIKITGVIGNTRIAVDNRKNQIIFLNKRNIKNLKITNSIDQAFSGSTGIGKYGFCVINIAMPANYYDVNVHPTKNEVRFKNEDQIYRVVYSSIKSAILSEQFLGNTEESDKKNEYVKDEYSFLTKDFNTKNIKNDEYDKINNNISNDLLKNNENEILDKSNLIKREEKRHIDYKFVGIIFRTYIIIEINNDLYLIDQHAAHERVLYEKIKRNYKNHIQNNSQMLLIPDIIDLTHKDMEFVKNNIETFKRVGYDIELFGENSVKINGIPDIDYRDKINRRDMFMDVLDEMTTNLRSPIKNIEERFIATVACKAAVKAHMDLTRQEVDNLIQNLLNLQNPYTCPHGRPTTIKIFEKNE